MGKTSSLRFDLYDAYGDPLNEPVDIYLFNQSLSDKPAVRGVMASKPILVKGLEEPPNGLYRVYIDPPSYLPVSLFVSTSGSKVVEKPLPLAVDPDKVIDVKFPEYGEINYAHRVLEASVNVEGSPGTAGQSLYQGLDKIRRAGLLNILAKARRTPLIGGGVVLDHLTELQEIRGDRSFARVTPELRQRVDSSLTQGLFREVSGALHQRQGYELAGSFKTSESYGNLQLTFFTKPGEMIADIDIDDAGGLGHVFQVLRNSITGRPTHPYNIHDILVRHQEIDPGYRFVLHQPAVKTKAAGQKA